MKRITKLTTYIVALIAIFAFAGCAKKDDASSNCNWESELKVYEQKLNAFSSNPTKSNCNALKDSAKKLLNKLGNCSDGVSIKESLKQWDAIDCSEF